MNLITLLSIDRMNCDIIEILLQLNPIFLVGILIIHDHKVVSTTFFKCEVGAGAVDARRLPAPVKLTLQVYGACLYYYY